MNQTTDQTKAELHQAVEWGVVSFETTEFRAERFFEQINALSFQIHKQYYKDLTADQKTSVKKSYIKHGGDLY